MARILIVEDNAANRKLVLTILAKFGHQGIAAEDGEIGLQLALQEKPDLIFMDVQMPGMNGLEATQMLKADPRTAAIPVIALTALAMRGDEERILAAGCDAYLAKPFHYSELIGRMESVLSGKKQDNQ